MNTKTMRLPPRRVLTSNKRKEGEGFDNLKAAPPKFPAPAPAKLSKPTAPKLAEPALSNQLLAGYLAHEYLTKGTLFGQQWDPALAQAVPVSAVGAKRLKPSKKSEAEPIEMENQRRYVEVSRLLKTDGAQLPGIVNPTQLAHFLQM